MKKANINTRLSKMPLYNDIKKAASLNWTEKNVQFLQLQELSQAEKAQKMNVEKVKKPKNIHLIDSDTIDDNIKTIDDNNEINVNFDKHEISAAIKEVNGGIDLSNKYWEEYWAQHLEEMKKIYEKGTNKFSEHNDAKIHPENHSKDKDLSFHSLKSINLNNRLQRNAAIMGLVKTKKISLEEIIEPNNKYFAKTKNNLDTLYQHETSILTPNDIMDNIQYHIESVPLPDNPEIFVHPLQMGLDKNKFKDIDFNLTRLGKKVKVTPPEFFLQANDDKFFGFIKKKKNI